MAKGKIYRGRIVVFCIAMFIFLIGICVYTFFAVRPLICQTAESRAETILLDCANRAVLNVLRDNDISYNDIVLLSSDGEGQVNSLEIDTVSINTLKSSIASEISRVIAEQEYYKISIPLGTFFGSEYTTGLGPRIGFTMQLASTAVIDFESNFTDAGINQVLHQILINMDISGSIIMTGITDGFSVSTSAIAAQTVIVGGVPDAFTQVIEEPGESTADTIFNYGIR